MRSFALAAVGGALVAGHGLPDPDKFQPLVTACHGLNALSNCTAAFTGVCRSEDGERFCGHEHDDHHHGDHHHWMHHEMHHETHQGTHERIPQEMHHGVHQEMDKEFAAASNTKGSFWDKVKSFGAVLFGPAPVDPAGHGQPAPLGGGSAPNGVAAWAREARSLQAVSGAAATPPTEHGWHHQGREHLHEGPGGHGHWHHEPNGFHAKHHGRPRHLGDCGAKKDGEKCTVAREGRCVPTGKCPVFQGQVVCKPWDAHPPDFITKPCEGKKEGDECKLPFGASKCEKRPYEELLVCRPPHGPAGPPPAVPPPLPVPAGPYPNPLPSLQSGVGPAVQPQVLPPMPVPGQVPPSGGPSNWNVNMPLVDPVPPSVGPDGKPLRAAPSLGGPSVGSVHTPLVVPVPPSVGPDGKPLIQVPSLGGPSVGSVHMPVVVPVSPSVGPDGKPLSFENVHLPLVVPLSPSVGPDGKPLLAVPAPRPMPGQGPPVGGSSFETVNVPLVDPAPPAVGPDGKPLLAAPVRGPMPGQGPSFGGPSVGTVDVPLADPAPPQPAAPVPGQPPRFGRPAFGPGRGQPPPPAGVPFPLHHHHHSHFGLPAFLPTVSPVKAQLPFGPHRPRFAAPSVGPDGKPLLAVGVPGQPQSQLVALPFRPELTQPPFVV